MAQYSYTAVSKTGQRVQGQLEASGENELRVMLRSQNLRPVKIVKVKAAQAGVATTFSALSGRISDADLLLFTRQMAILISSGIPLVQGLEIISTQSISKPMKDLVVSVKEKVSGGSFLHEAMKQYPLVFSELYISMIKAGEASGSLDGILKRLMRYLEDSIKLKKMVKGAMIYPVSVMVVGVAVLIIMLTFVIPKFEEMLLAQNQELPAITQFVIDASHFTQQNIFYILGLIGIAVILIRRYFASEEGKNFFDNAILKVPLFGELTKKVAVARFARTLQTMLASGINLLDSLEISKGGIGNRVYAGHIAKIKSEIEGGKTLAIVLAKITLFPSMMVQMVTVGETTGNLDQMLERVADFYEEEVQNFVSGMTKLMEPMILVVLGGMVAGLMVAMYLPVFKIAG